MSALNYGLLRTGEDEICQKLIQVSFTKIVNSKNERGGAKLHKNLLILQLLQKARSEHRARSTSPTITMAPIETVPDQLDNSTEAVHENEDPQTEIQQDDGEGDSVDRREMDSSPAKTQNQSLLQFVSYVDEEEREISDHIEVEYHEEESEIVFQNDEGDGFNTDQISAQVPLTMVKLPSFLPDKLINDNPSLTEQNPIEVSQELLVVAPAEHRAKAKKSCSTDSGCDSGSSSESDEDSDVDEGLLSPVSPSGRSQRKRKLYGECAHRSACDCDCSERSKRACERDACSAQQLSGLISVLQNTGLTALPASSDHVLLSSSPSEATDSRNLLHKTDDANNNEDGGFSEEHQYDENHPPRSTLVPTLNHVPSAPQLRKLSAVTRSGEIESRCSDQVVPPRSISCPSFLQLECQS